MPQNDEILPTIEVDEATIRQEFNEGGYLAGIESGEFTSYLKRNKHRIPPPKGEPVCTRSQIVVYYNRDKQPAFVVHQYLRPDGTLGASGLPDPKCIFFDDKTWVVK